MHYRQYMNSNYILGVDEQARKNLDIQHKILRTNSVNQLKQAGIKPGMVVWDVGCGAGSMTEEIAKAVGPKGHVYAVDYSKAQLEAAAKLLESAGLSNTTFIKSDISLIDPNEYQAADIVYSRMILMHVKSPIKIINKMHALLKKDGVISVQESGFAEFLSQLPESAIREYYKLVIKVGDLNGLDYSIGSKLPAIANELEGYSDFDYYTSEYPYSDLAELQISRLDEVKHKLIESELIDENQFCKLKEDLEHLLGNYLSSLENYKVKQHHLLLRK